MNGNGKQPDGVAVDPNAVIEALTQQIARLTLDVAMRDAAIAALQAKNEIRVDEPVPAEPAAKP